VSTAPSRKSDLLISVVASVRNAADYVEKFIAETEDALTADFKDYEIVLVDNGSTDSTVARIEALQRSRKNIQLYCLAAPIRQEIDILVGVDQAIGDVIVTIDARYDPPQAIPRMVEQFQAGAEIVYGVRQDRLRPSGPYQRIARGFFKLYRAMTGSQIPIAASGFRLMSRRVVNSFAGVPDRFDLFPVITAFGGFTHAEVVYDRTLRAGASSDTEYLNAVLRGLRILLLGTNLPLRLLTLASILGAFLSLLYSAYVIIAFLLIGTVEGWATLSLQISGLFFLLFLILATLSEYVFRIFTIQQERQAYLIARESTSRVYTRKRELNVTVRSQAETPARVDPPPSG
jgi:glycosyltransferase involved in cell wall biosynthesis